jgi:hypothetical protein
MAGILMPQYLIIEGDLSTVRLKLVSPLCHRFDIMQSVISPHAAPQLPSRTRCFQVAWPSLEVAASLRI